MEGVVAKRTLKRSYYENHNINFNTENEERTKKVKTKETFKDKIIFNLAVQGITTIAIIVFVILIKVMNITIVLEGETTKKIIEEFNKNYEIDKIISKAKEIGIQAYYYVEALMPEKLKHFIVNTNIKEVEIYEESSNNKSENKEVIVYEELGVGSSVEEKYITAISSVSVESNIVDKIKATGIKFVKPTSGTITSNFGAREVIFTDIDSYHTGVDIANKKGTKVVSSIEGKVTVASNNKYNGNYVVVENGDIRTIYCHLNKISVKKGAKVKAGTKIGEMGSTGYSTGPHLHFEIEYKGEKINPRLVVNI